LYLLDGDRIVHLLSWHQVQTEEQLGEALAQIKKVGVIPEDRVRLCVVADGAEWIWKHVQALFPQARQVLDYYHCAQYVHNIAKAQYGTSLQGLEWAEATMTGCTWAKCTLSSAGSGACSPRQTKRSKRLRTGGSTSMHIGVAPTIASAAAGAIR
jgi:hypothetical protein